jgi:hypothetical protein
MAVTEIYADDMVGLSVNTDRQIVKIAFGSNVPDTAGKMRGERVLILTLPARAAQIMLEEVSKATQAFREGAPAGPRN